MFLQSLINKSIWKHIILLTFDLNSETYITSVEYVDSCAEINIYSTVNIHIIKLPVHVHVKDSMYGKDILHV